MGRGGLFSPSSLSLTLLFSPPAPHASDLTPPHPNARPHRPAGARCPAGRHPPRRPCGGPGEPAVQGAFFAFIFGSRQRRVVISRTSSSLTASSRCWARAQSPGAPIPGMGRREDGQIAAGERALAAPPIERRVWPLARKRAPAPAGPPPSPAHHANVERLTYCPSSGARLGGENPHTRLSHHSTHTGRRAPLLALRPPPPAVRRALLHHPRQGRARLHRARGQGPRLLHGR